jgi:hypothetical protein
LTIFFRCRYGRAIIGGVKPDELYGLLALNRQRLDAAAAGFASLTDGLDHPRIRTARDRLTASGEALTYAAGGISGWSRTWIAMVVLGVAAWAVATVAGGPVGLSSGWVIVTTVAVTLALCWPMAALNNALSARVNRRRTTRSSEIVTPARSATTSEILMMLWNVRDSLVVVMKGWSAGHRFGYAARTATGFDWLRRRDRHLRWISEADRCICQAIDSIELWHKSRKPDR